jgi:hypothetical protein
MEDRDTVQSVPDDAKLEAKLAEMWQRGRRVRLFDSESETDATSDIANPLSGSTIGAEAARVGGRGWQLHLSQRLLVSIRWPRGDGHRREALS